MAILRQQQRAKRFRIADHTPGKPSGKKRVKLRKSVSAFEKPFGSSKA
jgi:hypothetical protein